MKMSRSLWAAGPLLVGLASPAVPFAEEGERSVDVIVLSRDTASAASLATRDARALGARVLTVDNALDIIERVTIEDVNRVADELLRPERMSLAVVGPYRSEARFAKLMAV
jgi:hypothetical protein